MKRFLVVLFVGCFASSALANDLHKISAEVIYYAATGEVEVRGYNAATGVYDPGAQWHRMYVETTSNPFTADTPLFPPNTGSTTDTDSTVGFAMPNNQELTTGLWNFGRIAMAGLSESDFLAGNWVVKGNARSSNAHGSSTPSIVSSTATYTPVPEPRFLAHGGLLGLIGLWLLSRRMR